MVNGQDKKFKFIDNLYKEYDNQAKSAVDISRQNEQITAEKQNIRRMEERARGVERVGFGEFGSQFLAGLLDGNGLCYSRTYVLGI